jgi:hypothetical protein
MRSCREVRGLPSLLLGARRAGLARQGALGDNSVGLGIKLQKLRGTES